MNVHERIHKEVTAQPDADAAALSSEILRMCSKADLEPLLVAAIENVQRGMVRSRERANFDRLMASIQPQILPTVPTFNSADFVPFLKQRIAIGDSSRTTWGLATVEEHRARLAMLMAQRNGLTVTIRRHEEAIRLLEESGARCLADVVATTAKEAA